MITKFKKICFRLSAVFAVLAVFSTLFVPARAEMIDYNDYVTDVQVDGENDLVTVRIPSSMAVFRIFEITDDDEYVLVAEGNGPVSYKFKDDIGYRVTVYPFGFRNGYNGLLLKYIPAGTVLYSGFGFDYTGAWRMTSTPELKVRYYYLQEGSAKENLVQAHSLGNSADWDFFVDSYTVESVDSTDLLCIEFFGDKFAFQGSNIKGVYAQDTLMVFSISSLLRQQQLTGKTNELLKEVELQLAEQGKTLDDIRDQVDDFINGEVTPEAPIGADRFDDLDDTEAGLRGEAQDGLDTGLEIVQNALDIVLQYATAFACAGWIFECFSTLPIFTALLFVSLALGVFGFVVNLAQEVGRYSARKSRSGKKGG